jgi:hypothetical protein
LHNSAVAPNSATARPGLIIFIGVAVIAIVLAIVVLIPLPSADRELDDYIPRFTTEQTRSRGQTMSAVALTTTQDVAGVLDFYRRKLELQQRISSRGGMATMTHSKLFGGYVSDAIMPLSGSADEAITITHREHRKVVFVAISRGKNESLTHLMVLLEQLPAREKSVMWGTGKNEALAWPPPDGKAGSSGFTLGVGVAEFSSPLPVENVVRHYSTNTGLSRPQLLLEQQRQQGKSALFEPTRSSRQSFYIFCFRDNASTQTQVSVTWVAK